jgi:hypothetical protein
LAAPRPRVDAAGDGVAHEGVLAVVAHVEAHHPRLR